MPAVRNVHMNNRRSLAHCENKFQFIWKFVFKKKLSNFIIHRPKSKCSIKIQLEIEINSSKKLDNAQRH